MLSPKTFTEYGFDSAQSGSAETGGRVNKARASTAKLLDMAATEGFADHLRNSGDLNVVLSSLFLLKFGSLVGPTQELLSVEAEHGVDSWFELMMRSQHYPNEDMQLLKEVTCWIGHAAVTLRYILRTTAVKVLAHYLYAMPQKLEGRYK